MHSQRTFLHLRNALEHVHMKSYTSEQGGCQEGSQGTQKGIPDFN
jgi:hypothetical protein